MPRVGSETSFAPQSVSLEVVLLDTSVMGLVYEFTMLTLLWQPHGLSVCLLLHWNAMCACFCTGMQRLRVLSLNVCKISKGSIMTLRCSEGKLPYKGWPRLPTSQGKRGVWNIMLPINIETNQPVPMNFQTDVLGFFLAPCDF